MRRARLASSNSVRILVHLAFLAAFSLLLSVSTVFGQSAPVISSISPGQGPVGSSVTINGQHFGATQVSGSKVTFNGVDAGTATTWTDTKIVASVPAGATPGQVYVTTSAGSSNGLYFRAGSFPAISSLSPQQGPAGTPVTINGQNFGASQVSGSTVTFGGVDAGTATTWTDTKIVISVPTGVPNGATTIYVTTTANGTSNGVFFRVGVYPAISSLSPQSGPTGTSVTINGQNFGASQISGSTVTFGGVAAVPTSWTDTRIVVPVPSGAPLGGLTIYVTTAANGTSNGVYFANTTPSISSLSPSSAAVGTSVTISGSNFGATQGSSFVKFNGTTAPVTTWTATRIVLPVPNGATSGNVVVTVGSAASNAVNFTVVSPPTITAASFPPANASGWNTTAVYVTFTCTPGGLPITPCPAPQTLVADGANQVVSGTVTDTSGDSATATVTVNIERTLPALSISSPVDQSVVTSAALSVSGTSANSLTNINSVTCNGATAASSAGAFSCNLSLSPGVNLVMVRATDVAGNVSGVPLHVNYSAALPAPTSLQISPASANVLVGATQQFTAIDQLGRPRTDATWTVDNTSVATISTDASPILTGVAAGTVTLTGSVAGISTQIQVNILAGTSLPIGTVLWSAPSTPGFTVQQIVQAVPTANGPDLYSIENNSNNTPLIRAMNSDGRPLWTTQFAAGTNMASVLGSSARPAMPDGSGGILLMVVANPGGVPSTYQLVDLDGQTGTQRWTYNLASNFNPLSQTAAIRGDGTIFKVQPIQGQPALIGIDPNTGSTVFAYVPPRSSYAFNTVNDPNSTSSVTGSAPGSLYSPTIGPDGTVYSAVSKIDLTATNYCDLGPYSITMTDSLLQVAPDGSTSLTQIRQDVSNQTYSGGSFLGNFTIPNSSISVNLYQTAPSASFFSVIPDGQGGVLMPYGYALTAPLAQHPLQGHITHIPSGGGLNDSTLPLVPGTTVLGENGTAFATDGSSVVSFAASSGSINWVTQVASSGASIIASTAASGLVIKTSDQNNLNTIIRLDSTGTPTADTWTASAAANFGSSGLANIKFLGSDAFFATKPAGAPLALFASGSPIGWPDDSGAEYDSIPEGNSVRTYEVPLSVYEVAGTSASAAEINAQIQIAQKIWANKINGLHLNWAGGPPTSTPVCDSTVSGSACDTDVTTHLDFISFSLSCDSTGGWRTLTTRFPNTLKNRGLTILYTSILSDGGGNPIAWTPNQTAGSCFNGYLVVMSFKALGADLAHEIGHALSLGDRDDKTGGLTAPGGGEVNLMCSGSATYCADGHVHGVYLDSKQLDQALHGGVLAVRTLP